MKFKVGDYVKIVKPIGESCYVKMTIDRVARIDTISANDSAKFPYIVTFLIKQVDKNSLYHIYKDSEIRLATEDEIMVEMI